MKKWITTAIFTSALILGISSPASAKIGGGETPNGCSNHVKFCAVPW